MTEAALDLLEAAFSAEIESAMTGRPPVIQRKGKLANQLVADGFLISETITLPGRFPVRVTGLALTERGRMAYCTSERVAESQQVE